MSTEVTSTAPPHDQFPHLPSKTKSEPVGEKQQVTDADNEGLPAEKKRTPRLHRQQRKAAIYNREKEIQRSNVQLVKRLLNIKPRYDWKAIEEEYQKRKLVLESFKRAAAQPAATDDDTLPPIKGYRRNSMPRRGSRSYNVYLSEYQKNLLSQLKDQQVKENTLQLRKQKMAEERRAKAREEAEEEERAVRERKDSAEERLNPEESPTELERRQERRRRRKEARRQQNPMMTSQDSGHESDYTTEDEQAKAKSKNNRSKLAAAEEQQTGELSAANTSSDSRPAKTPRKKQTRKKTKEHKAESDGATALEQSSASSVLEAEKKPVKQKKAKTTKEHKAESGGATSLEQSSASSILEVEKKPVKQKKAKTKKAKKTKTVDKMAAVQLTEEAAATRIQARYRGHAVRTHRVAVDKVVDNATNDEKTVVGEERESQQEPVTEEQRTRQAATRIQAGVRGHITRKNLRQQRQKQEEEEEEAERYRKDAAATKLQAGFRGSQVRRQRRDDNQRKQPGKEKHDEQPGEGAAKEAQRKERDDEKGREKDDAVSKKTSIEKSEKAAVKIQAGYRGFKGRQLVKEKRSAMDNTEKAAVKIQAGFRGYKGRRQAKEERVIRKFTFPKTHGTIVEGANFRPAQEATSLQKFLYSKKPNINGLTGLLATRNNAQRQTMKDNYQSRFLKDLLEEARSAELSGNFQELAIALLMQTADYDAHCISEAVSGIGTNAAMLTEVMCTQEAADIHNLTQQYKSKHNQKLESVFRSETTGDFQKLMMAICKGVRAADVTVNVADARRDAEMLAKAMHGSKSLKLINFFAKSSFSHIKETQEQYRQIFARPLRDDLKKLKRSQLLQNAFLTTAAYADHPVLYYSEKLHESINNDTMLIRLVVARCEVDLVEIKEAYKEMHHMSLDDAIESKSFNEDYKKLLLAITRGNYDPSKVEYSIDPTTNENPAKQSETDVASRGDETAKSATKEAKNGKKTSKKDTAGAAGASGAADNGKEDAKEHNGKDHVQKEAVTTGAPPDDSAYMSAAADLDEEAVFWEKPRHSGTIFSVTWMKVGQDCNELHKALKYNKLKEFVRLLIHRNKDQRQDLQKTYQQKFEQDLKQEVKSHFSGSARDAIIGLLMSSVEYDAFWLHNSMSGGATNEATLIEILATRDMQALRDIKENYRWEYNSDLEGDIAKATKGNVQCLMLELAKGERDESTNIDLVQAQKDAKQLLKTKGKLRKKDGSQEFFFHLLTRNNFKQIKTVLDEFQKASGQNKNNLDPENDVAESLRSLVRCIASTPSFFAEKLNAVLKRVGTDDKVTTRVLVSRSEVDLNDIKKNFQTAFLKELEQRIRESTSGTYKQVLEGILKGNSKGK